MPFVVYINKLPSILGLGGIAFGLVFFLVYFRLLMCAPDARYFLLIRKCFIDIVMSVVISSVLRCVLCVLTCGDDSDTSLVFSLFIWISWGVFSYLAFYVVFFVSGWLLTPVYFFFSLLNSIVVCLPWSLPLCVCFFLVIRWRLLRRWPTPHLAGRSSCWRGYSSGGYSLRGLSPLASCCCCWRCCCSSRLPWSSSARSSVSSKSNHRRCVAEVLGEVCGRLISTERFWWCFHKHSGRLIWLKGLVVFSWTWWKIDLTERFGDVFMNKHSGRSIDVSVNPVHAAVARNLRYRIFFRRFEQEQARQRCCRFLIEKICIRTWYTPSMWLHDRPSRRKTSSTHIINSAFDSYWNSSRDWTKMEATFGVHIYASTILIFPARAVSSSAAFSPCGIAHALFGFKLLEIRGLYEGSNHVTYLVVK